MFYINLPADGRRIENAAHFELKELRKYLTNSRNYLKNEALSRVAWETASRANAIGGPWVELSACKDRPNEPEATIKEFLSNDTKTVYECAPPDEANRRSERRSYFTDVHRIEVLRRDRVNCRIQLERIPALPELAIKPNTYTIERQLDAINRLGDQPLAAHLPLLRLLEDRRHADSSWPIVKTEDDPEWKVLKDPTRDGTLEQRNFVRKALATPDFAFLEGPPGSGKTTAICELILQVVSRGGRVLLSASTHVAVDNVLERLADGSHNEIVAVRIDRRDEEEAPELIKGLRLENFVNKERLRLLDFHRSISSPSAAQTVFRRGLESANDSERFVERLVLDYANVVAGTTFGILQHPDLKNSRHSKTTEPPFDMLIVDEASKTTFQEFLVPALWAKRWILVGDPRQLSPYADEDDLAPNIRSYLNVEWKRDICVAVSAASKKGFFRKGKAFISITNSEQAEFLLRQVQSQAAELEVKLLPTSGGLEGGALSLAGAVIIAGTHQDFERLECMLPLDIQFLVGAFGDKWHRRRSAWLNFAKIDTSESLCWEKEISWRIGRNYEKRWLPTSEQDSHFEDELSQMMPHDNRDVVLAGIDQVGRLALPSILESLMRGVGIREDSKYKTALSTGLQARDWNFRDIYSERAQLLSFQHRMHPDVSEAPRKLFYENVSLKDANGMASRRTWTCDRFGDCRSIWIEVNGQCENNCNEKEAREVCAQLESFLEWAESTPREERTPWEIAILTFYRGQESLIRSLLDSPKYVRTGLGHYARRIDTRQIASIKLCTVDRFQGHEADLVLLSFVKTRTVGFLDSPNRLNVAITRARFQLVMVGARKFFEGELCRSRALNELARLPVHTSFIK